MKQVCGILYFLLHLHFCSGQTFFNEKYDLGSSEASMNILPVVNNEYISVFQKTDGNSQSIYIIQVDLNGDTIWSRKIYQPGFYYYSSPNSLLRMKDSCFLFAGSVVDTTGEVSAILTKFNSNGDTLWMKIYTDSKFIAGRDCYENNDGSIILTGEIDVLNAVNTNFLLIKCDSTGNTIWRKNYDLNISDVSTFCKQTLDGGYIMSGSSLPNGTQNHNWIVKTDSAGVIQWNKVFNAIYADAWCWLTQLVDSTYLVVGKKALGSTTANGFIRKLKKNGDTLWTKEINNTPYLAFIYEPVILNDNSFVLLGTIAQNTVSWRRGYLTKFDSIGNEIWRRTYSTNLNKDHFFYDFHQTSDNGFVMCGTAYGTSQDAWIVKVDSFGCEVAGCDAIGFTEFDSRSFMFDVYPNPANDKITIEAAEWKTEGYIELIDVTGKCVMKEHIIF